MPRAKLGSIVILSELRDFIQQQGRVSLKDLVVKFNVDPDALRGMLQKWVKKGRIKQEMAGGSACGTGCCQCDPLITEVYQWVNSE